MIVAFDEMRPTDGGVRPAYSEFARWLTDAGPDVLKFRLHEAELLFRRIGITFAVYGEADAQERVIPFDVIPRIISAAEWRLLEEGLNQRVKSLNLFLCDVYGAREILRAGVVPDDLIFRNPAFRPEMMDKVRRAAEWNNAHEHKIDIEVDGGINPETAHLSIQNGANVLVAGTSIFHAKDYANAIASLRGDA